MRTTQTSRKVAISVWTLLQHHGLFRAYLLAAEAGDVGVRIHLGVIIDKGQGRHRAVVDADPAGSRAAAMRAAVLGCEGKWATNEEFVGIANEVFSPSEQAVAVARRVLEAAAETERSGGGVVTLDGKPIYMPQIKQARTLVEQADMLAAYS